MCQHCLDNRHCLSGAVGKQDEMEGMHLLVQIRSKFRNTNGFECFSKNPQTGKRLQLIPIEGTLSNFLKIRLLDRYGNLFSL